MDLFNLFKDYKWLARAIYKRPYQLVDLAHVSEEALKRYDWFRVATLFLKHVHSEDMLPFLKKTMELLRVLENSGEFRYINLSLRYMMEAGKVSSKDEFVKAVTEGLTYIEKDEIMVIADMFKKEVFERGKEKGREEGIEKGIEKGSEEKAILIAKNMLAENMTLELIARLTDIPIKQLKRITH